MKNFMNKVSATATKLTTKCYSTGKEVKAKVCCIIAQKSGEGFVDTALKILISVVVGALLLAGLYLLFNDTILPELTTRIKELFDYKG